MGRYRMERLHNTVKLDHELRKASADELERARAKEDAVSPTHYAKLTPQPIQVAHAWNLHHDLATALKYIARYNETQNLRDIEKAKRFLEFFINNIERGDPLADATP